MIKFFIIEQNPLSTNYMIYSKCEQLPQCYNGGTKIQATVLARELNILANQDFQRYFNGNLSKLTFDITGK